jgi:REP element-mobilizing transposase RayT
VGRRPRQEDADAIHHAVVQGNGRRPIVFDDRDRLEFELRFARTRQELGWLAHSWCLMDTHCHAVLETASPNLGIGLGRLQGGYARWLNSRHDQEGAVFRHRFWSMRILDDRQFIQACMYVVLNPVAAGLCDHPRDWRFCSYATTADGDPSAYAPGEELLLGRFGDTPREAREGYAALVDRMSSAIREQRTSEGPRLWETVSRFGAGRRR